MLSFTIGGLLMFSHSVHAEAEGEHYEVQGYCTAEHGDNGVPEITFALGVENVVLCASGAIRRKSLAGTAPKLTRPAFFIKS